MLRTGGTALAFGIAGCSDADWTADQPDQSRDPVIPTTDPTPPVTERTLYVAPDGRAGAAGSRAEPLDSLSDAMVAATPGTTVVLRGGTYDREQTVGARNVSGVDGAPIRIVPEYGEFPVFDFARSSTGGFRFSDCHWVELHGVEIRRAPSRGLFVEDGSSHVVVQNVTVRDSGGDPDASGAGVFVLDSSAVTLSGVVSTGNYDPTSGGRNADGIAVERSPGTLVEACVAAGNSDDGFDLWRSTDVTLRRCRAFDNGWTPDGSRGGDGNGFKLGGGGDSGDNRLEFCVAYGNRVRGFDDNGATRRLTLYNCTAWNNPVNFRLGCRMTITSMPICPPHRLRNNASYRGRTAFSPLADSRANTWDLNIRDPMFASLDPDDADFLRLTAESRAVDAGVDVGLPYHGARPDLGAFEYRAG
ncbi:hypothetical protein HSBGL_0914 [Halapricum desulfuricans]|uniref:Right handed beta helix domain-containing protein n=1 Tax=Halapricum desulfuricans TaxID=2841257 RepID=A0A897NFY0_9EURY|nr:hypothetical protein HSBGL_0914 [Halapricum desulfuricans]